MRKICGFTFGLLACISLALPLSAAPQFGRQRGARGQDEVCFFKDIQYQGVEECSQVGRQRLDSAKHEWAAFFDTHLWRCERNRLR